MRLVLLVVSLLLACGAHALSHRDLPRPYSIVGKWSLQVRGSQCVEYNEFFEDGTSYFRGGEEEGTSRYEFTPHPDGKRYTLVDTITSSNGKPSCAGPATPVGDRVEAIIHFSPSGEQFHACFGEGEANCIGPYQRIAP